MSCNTSHDQKTVIARQTAHWEKQNKAEYGIEEADRCMQQWRLERLLVCSVHQQHMRQWERQGVAAQQHAAHDKRKERSVISLTNAVIKPNAVMVFVFYTPRKEH